MKKIIKLNVLASNVENARQLAEAAEGNIYIGVMVKPFPTIDEAVEAVNELQARDIPVSVGLGAGDPAQWQKVVDVAVRTKPAHVNQVYPAAGHTIAAMEAAGSKCTIVNALIRPSGQAGQVSVLTGPISGKYNEYISCAAAAALLQESNIPSVKFYPIGGDKHLDEVAAMVKAAVAAGITMFEPTGGIDVKSVEAVVKTCLDNGATTVVPHIYTALVDQETGLTDPAAVKALLARLNKL